MSRVDAGEYGAVDSVDCARREEGGVGEGGLVVVGALFLGGAIVATAGEGILAFGCHCVVVWESVKVDDGVGFFFDRV